MSTPLPARRPRLSSPPRAKGASAPASSSLPKWTNPSRPAGRASDFRIARRKRRCAPRLRGRVPELTIVATAVVGAAVAIAGLELMGLRREERAATA